MGGPKGHRAPASLGAAAVQAYVEGGYFAGNIAPNSEMPNASSIDDLRSAFGADFYNLSPREAAESILSEKEKHARELIGQARILPEHIQMVEKLQSLRNNPDKMVIIYRGIPLSAPAKINAGDWVSLSRKYAENQGSIWNNGEFKIARKRVPAGTVYAKPGYLLGLGYDPYKRRR